MRKRVVIAGAIILVIGIAVAGAGFYLVLDQAGLGSAGVASQKTTVALAPAAEATIGTTQSGKITIVVYSANASAAIQVSSGGTAPVTRTTSINGETAFIAVFTTLGTGSAPIVLHNNQTAPLSVQYASVQTDLGALAYGGLLVLAGAVLFIAGLIVLIVGFVMKERSPPTPQ